MKLLIVIFIAAVIGFYLHQSNNAKSANTAQPGTEEKSSKPDTALSLRNPAVDTLVTSGYKASKETQHP